MRTQHLENVLRFLELFTNNCENRTQKYTAHDCIMQVKKYCTTCYDAIQCLAKYKNELTQLYKWNILTYYCLLHYYDFIESATILLKYRLKHPLCSSDTDNFSDLKCESRQLSYFNTLKDSSVLYHIKALNEESALYHDKALMHHTYIRGARLKPKINSVYSESVSERPEKQCGGISESPINLFSDEILKDITYEYIKHLNYNDEKAETYYHLLTDNSDRKWYATEEENGYSYFDFRAHNRDGEYPIEHRNFIGALRYVLKSYTMEQIFDEYITIECWFTTKNTLGKTLTTGMKFNIERDEVMLLKYLHSERSEREVKEVEHHDSY